MTAIAIVASFALLIAVRNTAHRALWRWYVATEQDGWRRFSGRVFVQVAGESSVLVGWRSTDGRVCHYIEL